MHLAVVAMQALQEPLRVQWLHRRVGNHHGSTALGKVCQGLWAADKCSTNQNWVAAVTEVNVDAL